MASRTNSDGENFSPRRVFRTTAALVLFGAIFELVLFRTWIGALSLTAAGLVAMINFRWLEVVVNRVIQSGAPKLGRWTVLRIFGRLALLAGILGALLLVPQIDPVAVILGFSTLVVALVLEGLRHARVGGG